MITWKILDVHPENEKTIAVRYHVSATEGTNTIESEGWVDIPLKDPVPEFKDIKLQDVLVWAKEATTKETINIVESRLNEQLTKLKAKPKAPWHPPDTFKVRI